MDGTRLNRRSRVAVYCASRLGDDPVFGKGSVRADGRKIHPTYLFEVKKPSESKGAWDYYKVRATIPAEHAFRPMAEGNCPLVKK